MFCQAAFDQWRTTIMQHLSHLSKPQATVLALWSGDPVEQGKRIKYRDLVTNAVMLHNVVDMTKVLMTLQQKAWR